MDEPGYVYVMINPSLEGMVKIGKSQRDPEERAKELSTATGVPTPFYLAYKAHFEDCGRAEIAVHELLGQDRLTDNREFFKVSLDRAIETIIKVRELFKEGADSRASLIQSEEEIKSRYYPDSTAKMCDELITEAKAYINGYGNILQDVDEGQRILKKAAKMGCVEANRELGDLFYHGSEVSENTKEARRYYQMGIESGDDTFWRNMGDTYQFEHPENWFKCFKNYFQSSHFGETSDSLHQVNDKASAINHFMLSAMLQFGVEKNSERKVKLCIQLLRWPLQQDIFLLGKLFQDCQNKTYSGSIYDECCRLILDIQKERNGSEVESDHHCIELLVKARKHLEGVDLKDREFESPNKEFSEFVLSRSRTRNKEFDPKRAHRLMIEAINRGCRDAHRELGDIYQYGDGINPDKKKAYSLYRKGVEQGNNHCWIGMANLFKWNEYEKWKACWLNYLKSESFTQQSRTFNYLEAKSMNARSFLDSLYLWLTSKHQNIGEVASWKDQIDRPEFDFESISLLVRSESRKDKVFANSLVRLCEILSKGWRGKDSDRSAFWAVMAKQFS